MGLTERGSVPTAQLKIGFDDVEFRNLAAWVDFSLLFLLLLPDFGPMKTKQKKT